MEVDLILRDVPTDHFSRFCIRGTPNPNAMQNSRKIIWQPWYRNDELSTAYFYIMWKILP